MEKRECITERLQIEVCRGGYQVWRITKAYGIEVRVIVFRAKKRHDATLYVRHRVP